MKTLDLNCDMGEGLGAWKMGDDEALLEHVTSANIACGFHAGDPGIMRRIVGLALDKGVAVGAHPSLPDLQGFGRRNMSVSAQEAYDMVLYQVGAAAAFVQARGARLSHVKPHGALYNLAAKDEKLAQAIAAAVRDFDPRLVLYGLSGSALVRAGADAGLRTAAEVFADRTYQADGSLTPRSQPDALIDGADAAVAQVRRMVAEGRVRSRQGTDAAVQADTLCIHGDAPGAVEFAKRIRAALAADGVRVAAISG
ncbi:MAG TPA: 5-oxoprolinase subunit PxpA [Burkholderiales bacterium]|nr:5-oxoprolinase subunit PxpA [Burkholderiales bacterium]